jgi:hypothetical protein
MQMTRDLRLSPVQTYVRRHPENGLFLLSEQLRTPDALFSRRNMAEHREQAPEIGHPETGVPSTSLTAQYRDRTGDDCCETEHDVDADDRKK